MYIKNLLLTLLALNNFSNSYQLKAFQHKDNEAFMQSVIIADKKHEEFGLMTRTFPCRVEFFNQKTGQIKNIINFKDNQNCVGKNNEDNGKTAKLFKDFVCCSNKCVNFANCYDYAN